MFREPKKTENKNPDEEEEEEEVIEKKPQLRRSGGVRTNTVVPIQTDSSKLKATVTQENDEREITNFPDEYPLPSSQVASLQTITDVNKVATPIKIELSSSGVIHTPSSGKKIRLKGFSWSSDADIVTAIRFGASGDLLFSLQTTGAIGMNLIGCNIEGAADQAIYGYLSAAGNMKGTLLIEEI